MNKQIDQMACEKCLHYEDCLKRFRKVKSDGFYELIDETEYFAHADDCDMFITGYRKASEVVGKIIGEILFYMDTHKEFDGADFGRFLAELEMKCTESEDTE